jgi:cyclopropane fatty-acyl-phospholipid synthase-like methyltransferase
LGTGYGGFLRNMARRKMLWSGVGVDISGSMIDKTKQLNILEDDDISSILDARRESFLCTSLPDESVDLVISMDSFLHVGLGQHSVVLAEAWRVLRPGGRMIFTDIIGKSNVDYHKIAPLYERIGLESFATLETYQQKSKEQGFDNFNFESHSENISSHYNIIHQVLC